MAKKGRLIQIKFHMLIMVKLPQMKIVLIPCGNNREVHEIYKFRCLVSYLLVNLFELRFVLKSECVLL